jgi:antitoxin CptB
VLAAVSGHLRWRCRRGVKELDVLLTRFLDNGYANLDAAERETFAALLALEDPELAGYCLAQQAPPARFAPLIALLTQYRSELSPPAAVSASAGVSLKSG